MALTRAQINSKITQLTREKNNCVNERTKYKNSLTYANKLVSSLNSSSTYLVNSNDYMKRFFTINNKTADGGKINSTKENINQIVKKLNNTIIPSINSNINNLTTRINNIDREINKLKRDLQTAQA